MPMNVYEVTEKDDLRKTTTQAWVAELLRSPGDALWHSSPCGAPVSVVATASFVAHGGVIILDACGISCKPSSCYLLWALAGSL